MQFEEGQSGNPKGRPKKDPALKFECQKLTLKLLTSAKYWAFQKKNPKAAMSAITLLLAYGHGKPPDSIEVSGGLTINVMLEEKK